MALPPGQPLEFARSLGPKRPPLEPRALQPEPGLARRLRVQVPVGGRVPTTLIDRPVGATAPSPVQSA